jgi:hypothetical protein
MGHVWERIEMLYKFWTLNLKERDHLKDLGVDGRIILKYILKKLDGKEWSGLAGCK